MAGRCPFSGAAYPPTERPLTVERCSKTFLPPTGTVADALRIIEESGVQICLVVDEQRHLLGTVTDGDVRRGILRSLPLDTPVTEIMRPQPRVARAGEPADKLLAIMTQWEIQQIPLVNTDNQVVGLVTARELTKAEYVRDN